MKWTTIKKALYDDYVGYASWFENFFDQMNKLVEGVNIVMDNGIRPEDNMVCDKLTFKAKHNVEKVVTLKKVRSQVGLVLVGRTNTPLTQPLEWSSGAGKVKVKFQFNGSPEEEQEVTIYVFE